MKQKQDLLNLSGLHYRPTLVPFHTYEIQASAESAVHIYQICTIILASFPGLCNLKSLITCKWSTTGGGEDLGTRPLFSYVHSVAVQTSWTIFLQPLLCGGGTWDILQIWSICTPLSEWVAISTSSLQFFNFMVVPMMSAHLIQKSIVRIHRLLWLAGTASEWHRFHIWCMYNIIRHFKELLWLTNYLPFPLHYRLLCMT